MQVFLLATKIDAFFPKNPLSTPFANKKILQNPKTS